MGHIVVTAERNNVSILPLGPVNPSAAIGLLPNRGEGMFCIRASSTLLAAAVVAAFCQSASAGDCCAPACAPACAPTYREVTCTEWVPEKYISERTVYKVEHRQEEYTAYKCEKIAIQKTRMVTCYQMVPETKEVIRIVCKCVPVEEERTIMQSHTTCKPVTKTVRKCVDRGHYECRLVEVKPSLFERLCKKNDCCEPCPKYKTKKCWVPCPVWEEHTVTCMVKETVCVPVKVKCTVNKIVTTEEKCQVTCHKCVAVQKEETYTCCETKMVPFKATRCVAHCVPHKETVECCRLVAKTVVKKIACEPACTPCCTQKKCGFDRCGGLFSKKSGCCN